MMVRRRLWPLAFLLIISLAVVLFAGCGRSADPDPTDNGAPADPDPDPDPGDEKDEPDPELPSIGDGDWIWLGEPWQMSQDFSLVQWELYEGSDEDPLGVVTSTYEGTEVIDGIETSRILLEVGDRDYTLWIDDDGEYVQSEALGQLWTGEAAETGSSMGLLGALGPFAFVNQDAIMEVFTGRRRGYFTWEVTSEQHESIGNEQYLVTRIDMVPENAMGAKKLDMSVAIAHVDGRYMIVEWSQYIMDQEDNEEAFIVKVVDMVRH